MIKKLLKIALMLLFCPSITWAFRLTPMVIHFSPEGNKATQVLTLENPGAEKVPIQIEAFVRTTNAKGEEVRTKSDDFNIYPEQVVLLPNEKRNVRITWAGDIKGSEEKAFRIIASQLPVDFKDRNAEPKKNGVNLTFLLQYVASAYVTPKEAVAKIKIKEIKKIDGKKISVTVINEGTAHKVLHPKSLKIFSGETFLAEISPATELDSINLLPKDEKTVTLATSKDISGKNLRGELILAESED